MIDLIIAILAIPIALFCLHKFLKNSFENSAYYEYLSENDEL